MMTLARIFLLAAGGTLFLQAVQPPLQSHTTESWQEILLRAGLSLFVGVATTLTYKMIESLKPWQQFIRQGAKVKQQFNRTKKH